ncbi:head-binding protein, partial [Candidatus Symbiopectobacterium sp. NZEC135]|nr:head-binding protein [Candidatus Symbiopectobacterium sp. NZEC135]
LTTQLPPSGTVRGYNVEIDGITVSTWYLKVENAHANPAYVAGLNIEPIDGDFIYDYDQFIGTLSAALPSGVSYYLGGLGANEFAAKEKSTGKFFGTYHGGHEGFLQRFRTDSASYNLDSSTAPVLLLTKHALLHSASTLRVSSTLYSYVASTQFGDGVAITNYAIKLGSGTPILCERIYTHMCTSARTFNWIHLPIAINKEDDGDVLLGQTGMIQQYRAEDAVTINCYFSQLNLSQNGNGGAYVSFQPNYNKQYYGPALGSTVGYPIVEGTFTTAKEFF